MKKRSLIALCALAVVGIAPASAAAVDYPAPALLTGDNQTHDPSMVIKPSDGSYAVYSTNDQVRVSTGLPIQTGGFLFDLLGRWLNDSPSWWLNYNPDGRSWAPDVSLHNGKYWMYYAVSTFGSQKSAIGLATSTTGDPGTWEDQGIVLASKAGKAFNAIDPALLVDASGRWWLTFGSFWSGIYQMELNPETGKSLSATPQLIHVAQRPGTNRAIENAYIVRNGDYYYLFASFDRCCQRLNSTYNIRVGRSKSPNGPFVDASGKRMLDGGGTTILASHDRIIGPGGQSVVYQPSKSRFVMVYHYYDGLLNGVPRLGMNSLGWSAAGWPYVK
jgi:arabinan endo-1,5-alpha-L-arabinosidase